jgi:hypothetical protein
MARTRRNSFTRSSAEPHYIVVWDLQWQVIECRRLARGGSLRAALAETVERLEQGGWRAESPAQLGFTFVSRAGERRLVMITSRDPFNSTMQSFSPFGASRGQP